MIIEKHSNDIKLNLAKSLSVFGFCEYLNNKAHVCLSKKTETIDSLKFKVNELLGEAEIRS